MLGPVCTANNSLGDVELQHFIIVKCTYKLLLLLREKKCMQFLHKLTFCLCVCVHTHVCVSMHAYNYVYILVSSIASLDFAVTMYLNMQHNVI